MTSVANFSRFQGGLLSPGSLCGDSLRFASDLFFDVFNRTGSTLASLVLDLEMVGHLAFLRYSRTCTHDADDKNGENKRYCFHDSPRLAGVSEKGNWAEPEF